MSLNSDPKICTTDAPEGAPKAATAPGLDSPGQSRLLALPYMRVIRDEAEQRRLEHVARGDMHMPMFPTHIAEREGEIIGYASIGPVMFAWLHTKAVRARESVALLNLAENAAAATGCLALCVPCTTDSPFSPFMTHFGYREGGTVGQLFFKRLRS
jgi:hypothetical protein